MTRTRWGFGLGTLGRDMVYAMVSLYLIVFLTEVLNASDFFMWWAGWMILAARLFDAVMDIVMGSIVDNTRSRWGHYKPWIAGGAVASAVCTLLLFTDLHLPDGLGLALLRDGFVEQSPGGSVRLADDGSPILDYDLSDYVWEGVRRAYLSMAELQFAAGAQKVRSAHIDARYATSWSEAKKAIAELPLKKFRATLFTAHLMGGCAMSQNAKRGVVDSRGRHHQLANLSVMDGSVFPTSIGANPQLSIFGLTAQNATALAQDLK
mgnify:CR=1 FL=1